jgi:hypothetical protein
MDDKEFQLMLFNALQEYTLDFDTEVEYGYGNGDNVRLTIKLVDSHSNIVLEQSTTINLSD